jgi:hypothetical protein
MCSIALRDESVTGNLSFPAVCCSNRVSAAIDPVDHMVCRLSGPTNRKASLEDGRGDFNAALVARVYYSGTDYLPSVAREHLQLLLNEFFKVATNSCDLGLVSIRIEFQILARVMTELPISVIWWSTSDIPGTTGGIEKAFPFL